MSALFKLNCGRPAATLSILQETAGKEIASGAAESFKYVIPVKAAKG
jgi:hypothetical protein